jgi:Holliday junction resolvase RusA-like endonuclease
MMILMFEKLIIPGELPGLNKIIADSKRHWTKYASEKKKLTENIAVLARSQIKGKYKKIDILFYWFCKSKKRDKDNIIAGQKFVIDALVKAGIIENDGWEQIRDIFHSFDVDKKYPRVEVSIKEVE